MFPAILKCCYLFNIYRLNFYRNKLYNSIYWSYYSIVLICNYDDKCRYIRYSTKNI